MKRFLTSFFLLLVSYGNFAQDSVIYDFNSLNIGNLNNQDDWKSIQQVNGTADFSVDVLGGSLVTPDVSQGVFYNAGGPGVGRTATRKATTNFNFNFQSGGVQEIEVELYRNYWGMSFGVGYDADGDGHIAPGLSSEPNDGGLILSISSQNLSNNRLILPNGTGYSFTFDNSAWCTYRMVMDFNANSGAGAIALFAKPGATGPWLAVPEIQGVNMQLSPGSGNKNDYHVWDGIFFHSEGATGGLDNIKIKLTNTGGLQTQFINFPILPNVLASTPPITLAATSTSGLPVQFTVMSGPANVSGNLLTLTGQAGVVQVKASQAGDTLWAPAAEVINSFEVVDAAAYQADLTIRRPADATIAYMDQLGSLLLVASAAVNHPEVLSISGLTFVVDGQTLGGHDWGTGYYTASWTPPAYGSYTLTVNAVITGGNVTSHIVNFEVSQSISDLQIPAFDTVKLDVDNATTYGNFTFPSFVGSFNQIKALLDVTCPPGGCDPWDRISNCEVRGPTGEWMELFRYLTPYGVPCSHQLDVTDFTSVLQGIVEMRFTLTTFGSGYVFDLNFDFKAGAPSYRYSWIDKLWQDSYPFGDFADLHPVPDANWNFEPGTQAARLKVHSSGHNWGTLNTGNAAEFYLATHYITINGTNAFTQAIATTCNPNPDGCQPQNGTWYHNRAGWCPGSISRVFDYDLSPYISQPNVAIGYLFEPSYVDYCHPNHPDCVTGLTCSNCDDPANPYYMVQGLLISYSDTPILGIPESEDAAFSLIPNPAHDHIRLATAKPGAFSGSEVEITSLLGKSIRHFQWDGNEMNIALNGLSKGVYLLKVHTSSGSGVRKLVVE